MSRPVELPRDWVLDPDLSPADLGTLARIVALETTPGVAELTIEELAIGAGPAAARAAIGRLIDAGYLARAGISARGRGNEYRIARAR